jgi:hypothetical protein
VAGGIEEFCLIADLLKGFYQVADQLVIVSSFVFHHGVQFLHDMCNLFVDEGPVQANPQN